MGTIFVPWLADAARLTGYPVVEIADWQSAGASGGEGMSVVEGVVGHHTATPSSYAGDYPSLRVVRDGRTGLTGPLSHYGLGRSGTVYVIGAGKANHAGVSDWAGYTSLNDKFIGIEAEDDGLDGVWTPEQLDAYPRLVAAILHYMRRDASRYAGHKDVANPPGRKIDPNGIDSNWMREKVAAYLADPTTITAGSAPAEPGFVAPPAPEPAWNPSQRLDVDGSFGPRTVRKLQVAIGVASDGLFGPDTKRALQRLLGVAADGIVGKNTVRALQRAVGASVDGIWGGGTTRKLQEALNAGRLTPTVHVPEVAPSSLAVDGEFGPNTIRALQRVIGVTADGLFGPNSKRALQRYLGVRVDGIIGPSTVRALQRKVGSSADGEWGPNTTRQLQRHLNAGTF